MKLTDDKIENWQVNCDALPNLHLLKGKENQSKLAVPFAVWIKKELRKPADAKGFLQIHQIPDVSLELSDFDQFSRDAEGRC
jgi:hypothetical protein